MLYRARFVLMAALLGPVVEPPYGRAEDASAVVQIDSAWISRLSARAEQLSRVLLSAMYAARDQGQRDNARCFDRALSELHSLQRQVEFHGERLFDGSLDQTTRERHRRALTLSSARLDYVAQSTQRCDRLGAPVAHGKTRVETTFQR